MIVRPTDWRLSFNHADKRLSDLDQAVQRFCKRPVYRVVRERDPETGDECFRAELRRPIPDDFAPTIQEILGGWRYSLDQLVYTLVCERVTSSNDRSGSAFPICENPGAFRSFTENGDLSGRCGAHKIRNVDPCAATIIEGLQPYNRGKGDYRADRLWWLNALRNIGHRNLHVALVNAHQIMVSRIDGQSVIEAESFASRAWANDSVLKFGFSSRAFSEGAEILRLKRPVQGAPKAKVKVQIDPPFTITFDKKGPVRGNPIIWTLNEIRDHILNEVFPPLERFV